MDQQATLSNLLDARSAIMDFIVEIKPDDDAARAQINLLSATYDALTAAINSAIAGNFAKLVNNAQLTQALGGIKDQTGQLNQLAKTLDNLQKAIGLADQILKLATDILELLPA